MLLPPEQAIRLVIQEAAVLQHYLGKEIGQRVLVLPNGQFFPDTYSGDAASVARLMLRLQAHAGMSDVPIQTKILGGQSAPEVAAQTVPKGKAHSCAGDCGGKGCDGCDGSCHDQSHDHAKPAAASTHCGSGCGSSCGPAEDVMGDEPRLVDLGDGWRVQVPIHELKQPLVLTTNLARALGFIFLVETRNQAHPGFNNLDAMADFASTLLGFGGLLLNGAHIYSKSCGGPQIRKVTTLDCGELALVTVLSAHRQNQDLRPLVKELDVTQKAAVAEAEQWLRERPVILERFANAPDRLAQGEIPMAPTPTGFFARLFGKRDPKADVDPESSVAELEAMLASAPTPAKKPAKASRPDPRADELRALVEEALADSGSQIQ